MPCHPPSEEGQPPRGGRKGGGPQGPGLGGVPAGDPDLELFQGRVTQVSAPGPRPAEERHSLKRPPGDTSCRENESTGREPAQLRGVGVGAPQRRSAGWAQGSPLLGGETQGTQAFIPQGSASDCPVSPRQTGVTRPRQALNTQEACSRAITRLCSPPHLAEPREDFLGSKPSNRTLHSSDPWGPNAADLSAVLGGQDG